MPLTQQLDKTANDHAGRASAPQLDSRPLAVNLEVVIAAAVERAKTEIRQDITTGWLPSTVRSFAELDEFVDANTYAGLTEANCPPSLQAWREPGGQANVAEYRRRVDLWLRAGQPA